MASRREHIYDLKRLLTRNGITDDSRLNDNHLGFLIDQRRAKEIRDTFKRSPVIEPIWIQDLGVIDFTPVNASENKTYYDGGSNIMACNCKLSKANIPPVVSLMDPVSNTNDLGTFMIRSTCGKYNYDQLPVDQLYLVHPDGIYSKMSFFVKVGNSIYLTPVVRKARVFLILDSPLDGYVMDNLYIEDGFLVPGDQYEVVSGNIIHNNIKYQRPALFTAVNSRYIGLGKVVRYLGKRRMTNDDPYPMSFTMAEVVKLKILSQDFAIENAVVPDVKNDSQEDSNIRK